MSASKLKCFLETTTDATASKSTSSAATGKKVLQIIEIKLNFTFLAEVLPNYEICADHGKITDYLGNPLRDVCFIYYSQPNKDAATLCQKNGMELFKLDDEIIFRVFDYFRELISRFGANDAWVANTDGRCRIIQVNNEQSISAFPFGCESSANVLCQPK